MPGGVDLDGDFVFDGNGEEGWCGNFEVYDVGGDGARDVVGGAVDVLMEEYVGVVRGLAGELDLEVAVEVGEVDGGVGNSETDKDDGELGGAGNLLHVKIAVGVAGVKGLDLRGEEEVAHTGVANAFAFGGVADAVDLMDGVAHVIGERRLVEHKGAVLGAGREREEQEKKCGFQLVLLLLQGRWMGQETARMAAL